MTEAHRPEPDVLPPEPGGALSVPPPVPQKKPGFLRRLFTSRKKQQAVAMQNGYLEMVDLIRAIRSHLDRQETVQTSVLSMSEKVPGALARQHEGHDDVQSSSAKNGMENNRRMTDSMGYLNNTIAADGRSQEGVFAAHHDLSTARALSEQLLREVDAPSERRMTALVIFFCRAVRRPWVSTSCGRAARGAGRNPRPAPVRAGRSERPAPVPSCARRGIRRPRRGGRRGET
jgi:hypothetical protein